MEGLGLIVGTTISVGVMCLSGMLFSSGMKWFHEYDIGAPKNSNNKKNKNSVRGDRHDDRINNLSKRVQSRS